MASVPVHVGEEPLSGRLGRRFRKRHRLLHRLVHGFLDDPEIGFAKNTVPETAIAEQRDRVALLLALDLLPRAIHRTGGISHRVTTEPVRARLDERRHALPPRPLDSA